MHVVRGSTRPDGVIWALQLILIKSAALRPPNHSKFPRTAVDIGLEAIQSEDFHIELCSPGESASNHLKRLHRKSAVKTTIAACIATEPSTTPLSQCHEPLLVPFPPKWRLRWPSRPAMKLRMPVTNHFSCRPRMKPRPTSRALPSNETTNQFSCLHLIEQ